MGATASCLYEGWIGHRRLEPVEHRFRYRIFLAYLDLEEIPELFALRWCWGVERRALASFHRADHYGDPAVPLDVEIRRLVREKTERELTGPIRILTHLRYFGYCFNPVSFYYCFDPSGREVECVVAEVHNTPWGERHCYVLDVDDGEHRGSSWLFRFAKSFHVSPFLGMDHEYEWFLGEPAQNITSHMKNRRDGAVVFDATMALDRREITTGTLARMLVRYPLMTCQVVGAIYLEALRLKLKRAPFFDHPTNAWSLWRKR
ncbi:MAG: DUF1365 domain-containing protein [Candidatus Binatia bacterium]|nr:DUF1365 domain-containing protein [Candidatus Binatia bacterium]